MDLEAEAEQLRSAWRRYSPEFLDGYLVHGVENPCFNPQSVAMRGLIIEALMPGRHDDLLRQERLYSACACMTLLATAQGRFDAFTAALEGEPGADQLYPLPEFLRAARANKGGLPFALRAVWQSIFQAVLGGFGGFTSPFEALWRERLGGVERARVKVLETACGSANDFRYFGRYGLDRLVDYTGVDISAANIANARRRCPQGTFLEGDAMRLPFADGTFDYYCVFDLFEHLSLAGMEQTLREAVRVTRRGLWLSFFQLDWQAEHELVPEPPYHRNVLSIPRVLAALQELGCEGRVFDIPADWAREFPGYRHYNPRGRIIAAKVRGGDGAK